MIVKGRFLIFTFFNLWIPFCHLMLFFDSALEPSYFNYSHRYDYEVINLFIGFRLQPILRPIPFFKFRPTYKNLVVDSPYQFNISPNMLRWRVCVRYARVIISPSVILRHHVFQSREGWKSNAKFLSTICLFSYVSSTFPLSRKRWTRAIWCVITLYEGNAPYRACCLFGFCLFLSIWLKNKNKLACVKL